MWQPGPEESARVLREQNPWHGTGRVPSSLAKPVERRLARRLSSSLLSSTSRRFEVVLGPRRVGKTTVMYQAVGHLLSDGVEARRIWWLRLDHPVLLESTLEQLVRAVLDITAASQEQPVFLLLDELVYSPQWDLWLKTFYDDHWPVRIAATSSATAALRDRRLESGVGRWDERYLAPYLLSEYLELVGEHVVVDVRPTLAQTLGSLSTRGHDLQAIGRRREQLLLTGGFPELLLAGGEWDPETQLLESQRTLRSDAVERAVYKDIPQSFGVDNPLALERLLYVLAGSSGGIYSATRVAERLDNVSPATLDRYLTYLERAFLVFTLPNYSGSESVRQRRGRKVHFVDPAVRNAALQRGLAPLSDPMEMGALLEGQAAGHFHGLGQHTGVRLSHWRDGRHEVDLVYEHPTEPLAFEIGSSPSHSRAGLRAFVARHPRFAGRCWLAASAAPLLQPTETRDGMGVIPLELLLVAVGAQSAAAVR